MLASNLYYREGEDITFGYDEVDRAMVTMYRLDFGQPIEHDLKAAIAYLKALPKVDAGRIGVTGFCLGGGPTFLTACRFSSEIAAAAPFYGMVLGFVASGMGVSLVASGAEARHSAGVTYRALSTPAPLLEIAAAWHKQQVSPVLEDFLALVKQA